MDDISAHEEQSADPNPVPAPEQQRPLSPQSLMKDCIIEEPQKHDIREIIELDIVKQKLRLQRQQFNRLQMMIVLPIKNHF